MRPAVRFEIVFLSLALTTCLGCSGASGFTPQSQQNPLQPTIAISAQPTSITTGSAATLKWTSTNATSVSIAGVGTFGATGSVMVTPTTTTTYSATATGPAGTATSKVTVTTTTGSSTQPTLKLTAQPASIASGASSVLTWSSTNASSVSIAGVGTFSASGSATVKPSVTTTYMATASGSGGTAMSSATVTVTNASAPSVTLSANPTSISPGASSTLSWTSSNATSVSIPGVGTFGATGSKSVTPSATTTYTATATGAGGSATSSATVTVSSSGIPSFGHVFIVVEENHGYSSVIGSSSMPYLNSLTPLYGLATQYYANTHPSIGNYFMMTTGQIITNNDSYNSTVTADNVVRHLITAGKTWKSYAESLPSVGYTGFDMYPYVKHHNPLAYFSDVVNSSTEKNNLVPFTQFATDLGNSQLPQYSFIVPNLLNDAHDGTLQQADSWLKTNIAALIASTTFKKDGLLIILFDEAATSDSTHGGGHVACLIISPFAKKAYQSTTLYQHQSALRLMLKGLGVTSYPGAAASAPDMTEFF